MPLGTSKRDRSSKRPESNPSCPLWIRASTLTPVGRAENAGRRWLSRRCLIRLLDVPAHPFCYSFLESRTTVAGTPTEHSKGTSLPAANVSLPRFAIVATVLQRACPCPGTQSSNSRIASDGSLSPSGLFDLTVELVAVRCGAPTLQVPDQLGFASPGAWMTIRHLVIEGSVCSTVTDTHSSVPLRSRQSNLSRFGVRIPALLHMRGD